VYKVLAELTNFDKSAWISLSSCKFAVVASVVSSWVGSWVAVGMSAIARRRGKSRTRNVVRRSILKIFQVRSVVRALDWCNCCVELRSLIRLVALVSVQRNL
jgi:hypothetical protein